MVSVTDRLIMIIEVATKKAEAGIKKVETRLLSLDKIGKVLNSTMMGLFKNLQNLFLGLGLALMFTGMALQRYFMTALKSLFQTFLMVEGETGPVNNALNQLLASLIFLKFRIIDAFVDTGLLDIWIARVERLIEIFDSLTDEQLAKLVDWIVTGLIIASIMMIVGQALLFSLGMLSLIQFIYKALIVLGWGLYYAALAFWYVIIAVAAILGISLFAAFVVVLTVIALIVSLVLIWISDMGVAEKILWTVAVVLIAIGIILVFIIGWWALILIAIGLATIAIVTWRRQILLAMLKAGKAINDILGAALNWAIGKLNEFLRLLNSIPGVNIPLVPTLTTSGRFEGAIAGLEADIAAERAEKEGRGTNITNNINIEGDVKDESIIDKMIDQIEERLTFNQGSPQI